VQCLKQIFNSVGAGFEKFSPSIEDLPGAFEHIECEIDALDEIIAGHIGVHSGRPARPGPSLKRPVLFEFCAGSAHLNFGPCRSGPWA
jgi:hypothetical protein